MNLSKDRMHKEDVSHTWIFHSEPSSKLYRDQ